MRWSTTPKKRLIINKTVGSGRVRSGPSLRRALAALALTVGLNGCATLAELVETPRVSIAELSVVETGLTRQRFRLALDVENTNPFPLPIARLDYVLNLAGQRFAAGSSERALTIGSSSTEQIALDIDTDLMNSALSLGRLFLGGVPEQLDYELSGGFAVDVPGVDDLLRFTSAGNIDLTRR